MRRWTAYGIAQAYQAIVGASQQPKSVVVSPPRSSGVSHLPSRHSVSDLRINSIHPVSAWRLDGPHHRIQAPAQRHRDGEENNKNNKSKSPPWPCPSTWRPSLVMRAGQKNGIPRQWTRTSNSQCNIQLTDLPHEASRGCCSLLRRLRPSIGIVTPFNGCRSHPIVVLIRPSWSKVDRFPAWSGGAWGCKGLDGRCSSVLITLVGGTRPRDLHRRPNVLVCVLWRPCTISASHPIWIRGRWRGELDADARASTSSCSWILWHPTVVQSQLVGPQRCLDDALVWVPDLRCWALVVGMMIRQAPQTYLPRPEEPGV